MAVGSRRISAPDGKCSGIAGLGLASEMIYRDLDRKTETMRQLKAHFLDGLSKIEHTKVHGFTDEKQCAAYRKRRICRGAE